MIQWRIIEEAIKKVELEEYLKWSLAPLQTPLLATLYRLSASQQTINDEMKRKSDRRRVTSDDDWAKIFRYELTTQDWASGWTSEQLNRRGADDEGLKMIGPANRWKWTLLQFLCSVVGFANSRRRRWEKGLGFVRERMSAQMKFFFFKNILVTWPTMTTCTSATVYSKLLSLVFA